MTTDPLHTDRYAGAIGRWIANVLGFKVEVIPPAPVKEPIPLSPRARKLYDRMLQGEWYIWGDKRTPKAMAELEAAGLVGSMGRVQTIVRCWVPVGSKPFEVEEISDVDRTGL